MVVMNEWHVAFIVLLGAFINKIFLAIRYFSVEHSSEDRSNIIFDIFIVVTGMGLVWTWHGKSITKEIQQSREETSQNFKLLREQQGQQFQLLREEQRQQFQLLREERREQHKELMDAINEMTRVIREMNANSLRTYNAITALSEDVAILSADVIFLSSNIENTVDELSRGVRNDIRSLTSRLR